MQGEGPVIGKGNCEAPKLINRQQGKVQQPSAGAQPEVQRGLAAFCSVAWGLYAWLLCSDWASLQLKQEDGSSASGASSSCQGCHGCREQHRSGNQHGMLLGAPTLTGCFQGSLRHSFLASEVHHYEHRSSSYFLIYFLLVNQTV